MRKTYIMSDIHGMGRLLERMLEKIGFSGTDVLYILGDMIDRGPDPALVLDIASSSENVIALRGNHEDEFVKWYDRRRFRLSGSYYYNTWDLLNADPAAKKKIPRYVEYMRTLPYYRKLRMDGTCYLLAHASTMEILQVWKNRERLLWDSSMIDRQTGIPGYVSVVGHVPTFIIRGYPGEPASIWHSPDGSILDVDCGAAFPDVGGRLGCICLNTGEEFYVSGEEAVNRV